MIEILDNMPPGALGVRASGKLTAEDYEQVLAPAIEKLLESADGLRVVLQFDGDEDLRLTPGAVWDDFKLGAGQGRNWKRLAILTDSHALERAMRLIGWMFPGEVRIFAESEMEAAKAWVIEP